MLINLVAINSTATGNLRASAAGVIPTGGVLNFAPLNPAMNNSNAVPVALSGGQLDVAVNTGLTNATDAVHIRGVILGYYVPTPLAAS